RVQPPAPGGAGGGDPGAFPTYPSQPTGAFQLPSSVEYGRLLSVPTINRLQFIKAYANMVARTWTDDSFRQLLLSDPVTALASARSEERRVGKECRAQSTRKR